MFKFKVGDYVRLLHDPHGNNEGLVDKVKCIEVYDNYHTYKLERTGIGAPEEYLELTETVTFKFVCDKCGKVLEWTDDEPLGFAIQQSCWHIDLGTQGYGSKLDSCRVKFKLCDDCVYEIYKSLSLDAQIKIDRSGGYY